MNKRFTLFIFLLLALGCTSSLISAQTITTLQPSVTRGPDTLCNSSAIDVLFFSTGTYHSGNNYIAQLSDAGGSFASPVVIGTSTDAATYDSAAFSLPGIITAHLNGVVPGCGYFIRVVSTSPAYTPSSNSYFGPFCIRQCDITTNNSQDVRVCLPDSTTGLNTSVSFKVNSWNNNAQYSAGNEFLVQVVNPKTCAVINTGGLGAYAATTGETVNLHVPGLDSLQNVFGIHPGSYYLRFIPTQSNASGDTMGTLVRFTIGFTNPSQPVLVSSNENFDPDSVFCTGAMVIMSPVYYNINSQYQWQSSMNFGLSNPFTFAPPLGFNLNISMQPGKYWFLVREENNGCFSAWSDTAWITVLNKPDVTITSSHACAGDTALVSVPYISNTHYSWSFGNDSAYHVTDTMNNEIKVVFDSIAVYKIYITAVNQCGSKSNSKNINVTDCSVPCTLHVSVTAINASCPTCNDGSAYVRASYGRLPYTFTWNTSQQGDSIFGLAPGTYTVCVSDQNGCSLCDTALVATGSCSAAFNLYADTVPHNYIAENNATGVPPITYLWSWGDGSTSTGAYPSHTYANAGFYNICLDITDSTGCTNHFCSSFNLQRNDNSVIHVSVIQGALSVTALPMNDETISVFPNPVKDYLVVDIQHITNVAVIRIYNMLGQIEYSSTTGSRSAIINTSLLPAGTYVVELVSGRRAFRQKFVKTD